ncbi:phosphotransferase [candidate division KSB1 bacterium]|nr:phosphotransferase [candidate division KSB1 bacterium]
MASKIDAQEFFLDVYDPFHSKTLGTDFWSTVFRSFFFFLQRSFGKIRKATMKHLQLVDGHWLDRADPLYPYLQAQVLPQLGVCESRPEIGIDILSPLQATYACHEQVSGCSVVLKFFGRRDGHRSTRQCREQLNLEFANLVSLRQLGFDQPPLEFVRPLNKNDRLDFLLVEEYAWGHDLDYYIARAAHDGQGDRLAEKLELLALFLYALHDRTRGEDRIAFANMGRYLLHLGEQHVETAIVGNGWLAALVEACGKWCNRPEMWAPHQVSVHGDVTPTNFIFPILDGVLAIDLERMHRADPAYDLGFLAAELRHHFALRVLHADRAEPFIAHFFRSYCRESREPEALFNELTMRNRFYMALAELRIARNTWLPLAHRRWLCEEAVKCLQ